MRVRMSVVTLLGLSILVACSGGSSSLVPPTSGTSPGPASPAIPLPSGSAGALPPSSPGATNPMALSTAPIIGIDGGTTDPRQTGVTSLFADSAANSAPASSLPFNQIDGIPAEYRITETGRHLHNHLTVIDGSGRRVAIPQGIGMIGDPAQPLDPYPGYALNSFTAGGSTGTYYLHTHDHTGFIHAEDDPALDAKYNLHPPAQYTLGNLLHIWGETADANHFTKFVAGPIHVYISQIYIVRPTGPGDATTEVQTAPIEWKGDPLALPAVAADDFAQIPLKSLQEITVEVGNTYHPVPRYYFPAYWCQSRASDGLPDCTLDAAPADVAATAAFRRP